MSRLQHDKTLETQWGAAEWHVIKAWLVDSRLYVVPTKPGNVRVVSQIRIPWNCIVASGSLLHWLASGMIMLEHEPDISLIFRSSKLDIYLVPKYQSYLRWGV